MVQADRKVCLDCTENKPLDSFYAHPRGTLGRQSYCKACVALRAKVTKKLKQLELPIERITTTKELAGRQRYRVKHRLRRNAQAGEVSARRRALLRDTCDGSVTPEFINELYAQSRCAYCGSDTPREQRTSDHVVPLSRGGLHTASNLVMACDDCNDRKGNRTDVEFCGRSVTVLVPGKSKISGAQKWDSDVVHRSQSPEKDPRMVIAS